MSEFAELVRRMSPQKLALLAMELRTQLDARDSDAREPIAIIGLGCRFPGGADTPDKYWQLLVAGTDAITEIPADRWPVDACYDPDPDAPGKMSTRFGGFVSGLDRFDAQFFGVSPREAASMDPQQRLVLEVAWEALEDAGRHGPALAGSRTGVFLGTCTVDHWADCSDTMRIDAYTGSGNSHSIVANRLSYVLDLRGPSLAVDSACSSSLVAVHLACRSLRVRECGMALVGGVNAILSPRPYLTLSKARMLAPDGRCRTFDARADGYVRSEGCGIAVLKRLSDARADRDRVIAVIRGSAVNQDGRSNGLTAPNLLAQQAVIRDALGAAGVAPSQVGYIEAHGTGTSLGDPIEVEALKAALGERPASPPCVLGSVKTNIGHLEAAAGIAGLIKAALCVARGELPPHLHFRRLNPNISLEGTPFVIAAERQPWPRGYGSRIAGVSSFGFGGTNAHVVLEERPADVAEERPVERSAHVVCLSAKRPAALAEMVKRVAAVAAATDDDLADVAYTANVGRGQFSHRLAIVADSTNELCARLGSWAPGVSGPRVRHGIVEPGSAPRIAFLFTGQGSQYPGMGRDLYVSQPSFRATLDECDERLRPLLPVPLLSVLYGDRQDLLDQTAYTQPALFALEYALATLWKSWGVEPSLVIGHSVGEYTAACVAGMLGLEDALELVAVRGRLMQSLPTAGAMAVVFSEPTGIISLVARRGGILDVAAINGPSEVVVSGTESDVEALGQELRDLGISWRRLRVSHAFHSRLMEPMLVELAAMAGRLPSRRPRIPVVSNVSGEVMREAPGASYWSQHARQTVQFAQGMRALTAEGITLAIEIGPGPALCALASKCLPDSGIAWLPSMRPGKEAWPQLLDALAAIYVSGANVDWAAFDRDYPRRRTSFPTYPFQRELFPITLAAPAGSSVPASTVENRGSHHPLLGTPLALALTDERRFERDLADSELSYLQDHRVGEAALFPAAGFVELARAAAEDRLGPGGSVTDLQLHRPLVLSDPGQHGPRLQTIVTPVDGTHARLHVLSRDVDAGQEWTSHVTATIETVGPDAVEHVSLDAIRARCAETRPAAEWYDWLRTRGLEYGPHFQCVEQIAMGHEEALGWVRLRAGDGDGYAIHPALLDGCLQVAAPIVAELAGEQTGHDLYVPAAFAKFELFDRVPAAVWSWVTTCRTTLPGHDVHVDIHILDESGRCVARAGGVRLARVPRSLLTRRPRRASDDSLYELHWAPQLDRSPRLEITEIRSRPWLVFADDGGVGRTLATELAARGRRAVLVMRGDDFLVTSHDEIRLDPSRLDHFERLLDGDSGGRREWEAVVHLWNLDQRVDPGAGLTSVHQALQAGCGSLLNLTQALVSGGRSVNVWVATAGVHPVRERVDPAASLQAAAWGFLRVLALEHPELRPVCVDLDAESGVGRRVQQLLDEIAGFDGENQVAWRDDVRHVLRLRRSAIGSRPAATSSGDAGSYRLDIAARGVLDRLTLTPVARRVPGAGEVELRVHTTGLNFRDVLNALGLYPGDAGPLGLECVGTITAVGERVPELAVGQEVIALAPASFSQYVIAPAALVAPKPLGVSDAAGATITVAFLTAAYAFERCATLQPGERVLIHAAAGGVGLAAIQIARRKGAEVIATAGSDAKRAYLRGLGIQHVSDSRSTAFVADVRRWTDGAGVDVVLNSLAGELIPAGLSVLAHGGRFVEIGKTDWTSERIAAVRPDVQHWLLDLGEVVQRDPSGLGAMLSEIVRDVGSGALQPLPHREFAIGEVGHAFRHMSQAKHIGKIVVTHPPAPGRRQVTPIHADGQYLITGGVGALGLKVAAWLVAKGAKHLVLIGRHDPSPAARQAVSALESAGARVVTIAADASDAAALRDVFARIAAGPPLRGIVHAAGVLDDGVILEQRWERCAAVLAPKVDGAWNLLTLTAHQPLDFFVMFGSVAGIFGSPGQSGYAAGNAVLDALAHQRAALGQTALSVDWGPWLGSGMASDTATDATRRWLAFGISPLDSELALARLEQLIEAGATQAAVAQIDWSRFGPQSGLTPPRLFADLAASPHEASTNPSEESSTPEFVRLWESTPPERRHHALIAAAGAKVVAVLGLDPRTALDSRSSLGDAGLDSLMAVELRNAFGLSVGRTLPATLLFDYPTLEALAGYLATQLSGTAAPARAPEVEPLSQELDEALLAVEQLSDAEAAGALRARTKRT